MFEREKERVFGKAKCEGAARRKGGKNECSGKRERGRMEGEREGRE